MEWLRSASMQKSGNASAGCQFSSRLEGWAQTCANVLLRPLSKITNGLLAHRNTAAVTNAMASSLR